MILVSTSGFKKESWEVRSINCIALFDMHFLIDCNELNFSEILEHATFLYDPITTFFLRTTIGSELQRLLF
jgi:hypothetical protein